MTTTGRRFFFQAEDGIRDDLVTGVQTCALPIWSNPHPPTKASVFRVGRTPAQAAQADSIFTNGRSEERRVGKECRSGGAASVYKNNGNSLAHVCPSWAERASTLRDDP